MTTFYIARHGETTWNKKNLMQGQKDSPLTLKGIEQAKELANKFKTTKFDQVFSSDLLRAKKTAEIMASEHTMLVATSKLLREKNFGIFEGRKESEMRNELKKEIEVMNSLSLEKRLNYRLHPSLETDQEAISRIFSFLRSTSLVYPNKSILVVCHGGMIRRLLIHLGKGDANTLPRGSVQNGGYVVLESDGIEFFVKKLHGIKFTSVVNKH